MIKIGYCQEVGASLRGSTHMTLQFATVSSTLYCLLDTKAELLILSCLPYYFKKELRMKVGWFLYSCCH